MLFYHIISRETEAGKLRKLDFMRTMHREKKIEASLLHQLWRLEDYGIYSKLLVSSATTDYIFVAKMLELVI